MPSTGLSEKDGMHMATTSKAKAFLTQSLARCKADPIHFHPLPDTRSPLLARSEKEALSHDFIIINIRCKK